MTRRQALLSLPLSLGLALSATSCRRERDAGSETVTARAPDADETGTPPTGRPEDPHTPRVTGRVVLDGPVPPVARREVAVDRVLCGTEPVPDRTLVVDPASHGVRWAVVTLDSAGRPAPAPVLATVGQARCQYFPYVTVVPPGSRVVVENDDGGLHDVHVLAEGGGRGENHSLPPGATVTLSFDEPGRVQLACDLHHWSRAWVVVSAAPFAAVTGADGDFAFEGVPAGTWRLTVWHERLGSAEREVVVGGEGRTALPEVALPPPAPARPRPRP